MKDDRQPNERIWFEYRCLESHDSADAVVWYRSHQQVTVVNVAAEGAAGATTMLERGECGEPRVYRVRFDDGFEYDVWEDELVDSPAEFHLADPPAPKS